MSQAIVYTSNTGYTKKYAELLSQKTGLPLYDLEQAARSLPAGAEILYLGWLMAGSVKGYKKAAKIFRIRAVIGVGMAPNGALEKAVRKSNGLDDELAVFTLQGGYDRSRLKGIYGLMMDVLVKKMARDQAKKDVSDGDREMLRLMTEGGDWVTEESLTPILDWYQQPM